MVFQNQPKRKKLSLSKKPKPLLPSARFNTTVSSEEIEKSLKGCIPVGTAKSTNWAVCTFQQWLTQRNNRVPQEVFPEDRGSGKGGLGAKAPSHAIEGG